jgi:hypothetical protein
MRRHSSHLEEDLEVRQCAIVATAMIRQLLRRLDERDQQRAIADAERELMEYLDLDVEIDAESLAAQAATAPDVDVEASDD